MPRILVCYKWVLDEQDIKINRDNLSLDTSKAKYKIGEYDRNAIEEGVLLAEKLGGSVDVLTFGTAAVKQSLKDVLSRGPEKAYFIGDPLAEKADASVTAAVLAAAIRKIGPYDIILCAEGSTDEYNQQVAPRLAKMLDIPAVTFVNKLSLEGNQVQAARKLGDCTEVLHVEGAAVVSVMPEINKPRIPSLKQVLAAAKKPSEELKLTDLQLDEKALTPKVIKLSIRGFVMNRKNIIHKELSQTDNVAKLVAELAKEGVY
ncbi:electron transfer flavoprotein subunit beta/FixA family protein [Dehalobacter sp. DCM]|uniref:electron transfer flavoprotein subunit beta/FixA family protein n=1 Tax=Dehalobacter sp. DCM TaxID=2907827 RepID=UPI0030813AB8|nr:electron transfer flavoprotein subunit beta/FixA family protein [Dehalobacter sp. DCM]